MTESQKEKKKHIIHVNHPITKLYSSKVINLFVWKSKFSCIEN